MFKKKFNRKTLTYGTTKVTTLETRFFPVDKPTFKERRANTT